MVGHRDEMHQTFWMIFVPSNYQHFGIPRSITQNGMGTRLVDDEHSPLHQRNLTMPLHQNLIYTNPSLDLVQSKFGIATLLKGNRRAYLRQYLFISDTIDGNLDQKLTHSSLG